MTTSGTRRAEREPGLAVPGGPPFHVGPEVRSGIEPLPVEEQRSVTTREKLDATLPRLAGIRRADQHLLASVAVQIRDGCNERRARQAPNAGSEAGRPPGHGGLCLLIIQAIDSWSQEKKRHEVKRDHVLCS